MKGLFTFILAVFLIVVPSDLFADEEVSGQWQGSVFAGFSKIDGNTNKTTANFDAQARKKAGKNEYSLKTSFSYSETNDKMDVQKWDILPKYAHDFGPDDCYFNFYQVYLEHDYFSDIDYRVTPSLGVGKHIKRLEGFTWDADIGIGYRITRHRLNTAADDKALTGLLHTFLKKSVFERSSISQDLAVYPGLESGSGVIVRSETAFTNPLNERMDLEIKYILDHNSEPAADKKKTDTQLVAGLKYNF